MDKRRCLKIAQRIDTALVTELGLGLDPARMIADALYARDVLLVCDAMRGGELAQLARMYRAAERAEPAVAKAAAPEPSVFSSFLSSLFGPPSGPPSTLEHGPAVATPRSGERYTRHHGAHK